VECNIKGEESVHLCPDGLVFDIYTQNCDYPAKVDCTLRPELRKHILILLIFIFNMKLATTIFITTLGTMTLDIMTLDIRTLGIITVSY
jgi:hypothetical protein